MATGVPSEPAPRLIATPVRGECDALRGTARSPRLHAIHTVGLFGVDTRPDGANCDAAREGTWSGRAPAFDAVGRDRPIFGGGIEKSVSVCRRGAEGVEISVGVSDFRTSRQGGSYRWTSRSSELERLPRRTL